MGARDFLKDWTLKFLKNKDSIFNNIMNVENLNNEFDFKIDYKDKTLYCVSREKFNEVLHTLETRDKNDSIWITVINCNENFDFLLNYWNVFIGYANLTICFANPFSSLEKKWIVKPAVHHLVSDNENLAQGLKAISENVEKITLEEFEAKCNINP